MSPHPSRVGWGERLAWSQTKGTGGQRSCFWGGWRSCCQTRRRSMSEELLTKWPRGWLVATWAWPTPSTRRCCSRMERGTEEVAFYPCSLLSGLSIELPGWSPFQCSLKISCSSKGSRMRCAWHKRTTMGHVTRPTTASQKGVSPRAVVRQALASAATLSTCAAHTPWRMAPTLSTLPRPSPCAISWSPGSTTISVRFDLSWMSLRLQGQMRRYNCLVTRELHSKKQISAT